MNQFGIKVGDTKKPLNTLRGIKRGETTAGPIWTEGTKPPMTNPSVTAMQPNKTSVPK